MAPLLLTHFRARHRSVLTTLFAATFLGAVAVVAFPCPARVGVSDGSRPMTRLDCSPEQTSEVVTMMNKRGATLIKPCPRTTRVHAKRTTQHTLHARTPGATMHIILSCTMSLVWREGYEAPASDLKERDMMGRVEGGVEDAIKDRSEWPALAWLGPGPGVTSKGVVAMAEWRTATPAWALTLDNGDGGDNADASTSDIRGQTMPAQKRRSAT
ncbi:hypothetical protein CspeluHIS016_0203060 [Cutaneotrichosporon spelunceum]|uniref:Uncharacterized protein n=1 Tax=Cutaneotrichosporon spelunceum TaxID=1672016 RepID=A0AAD3Y9R2_9TREE|nr:hypothetical protein CspeluHIS016_0203060 [Cutaneotrichosporon spelunceum]